MFTLDATCLSEARWQGAFGVVEVVGNATAVGGLVFKGGSLAVNVARGTEEGLQAASGFTRSLSLKPAGADLRAVGSALRHPIQTGKAVASSVAESYTAIGGARGALKEFLPRLNPRNYSVQREGWDVYTRFRAPGGAIDDLAAAVAPEGLRRVSTGGLRNEMPLTNAQRAEASAYLRDLDVPEDIINFSENMNTGHGIMYGQEILYVGTDVLPGMGRAAVHANSRLTMKAALAHEIVGHRAAALAGRSHPIAVLEEAQASIRAARFAPGLTSTERITLLRDALERLPKGTRIRDVKSQLWINE